MTNEAVTQHVMAVAAEHGMLKPKRKYTKGPKFLAYIKRKKKHVKKTLSVEKEKKTKYPSISDAGYTYIDYIGHGLHKIQKEGNNYVELWESVNPPVGDCIKYKCFFLRFREKCLPVMAGINTPNK